LIANHGKAYFLIFIVSLLLGCSRQKPVEVPGHIKQLDNLKIYRSDNAEPPFTISLIPDNTYGDTKEVLLGPLIKDIAVDEQGQVYIADYRKKEIHVYHSNGSFQQSIGREGRGPGEFLMIWDMEVRKNKLAVLDFGQTKISEFDTESLELQNEFDISLSKETANQPSWLNRTQKRRFSYRPTKLFIKSSGNYLIIFSDETIGPAANVEGRTYEFSFFDTESASYIKHDLYSFKWTGKLLFSDDIVMFKVPYKRGSLFDYESGQLIYGWNEELLLTFYKEIGTYQRAIYYPQKNITLTKDAALSMYKNNNGNNKPLNAVRNDTLPATWPAFNSFLVDDKKRIWVSIFTDQPETYEWRVLQESGKLLAKFKWPRKRNLKEVKNGYAYTLEKDEQTGLQNVVRYRIEMEEI